MKENRKNSGKLNVNQIILGLFQLITKKNCGVKAFKLKFLNFFIQISS